MPPQPFRPDVLAWQVFRGSGALRDRLLTPHQLRSKAWLHVMHDVYADSRLPRDHTLKCTAALLRLPACAVLAGPSAAWLDGVAQAAEFDHDVHAIVPPGVSVGAQRGLRVHNLGLDPVDIVIQAGVKRTAAHRTAWDLASWFGVVAAVPLIDSMLAQRLLTPAELAMRAERAAGPGGRGSRRARQAFRLADGRSRSPAESLLRVRLVLAGLPAPVPRFAVRIAAGLDLHPSLAWSQFKVAVEYQGNAHGDADQPDRDRRRLNQLAAADWLVLHVTSERLDQDFPGVLHEIRQALAARGWRRRRPRGQPRLTNTSGRSSSVEISASGAGPAGSRSPRRFSHTARMPAASAGTTSLA